MWPALEALRASLAVFREQYSDNGDVLEAFAAEADAIQARAEHDDDLSHHVYVELNHMLVNVGLLPESERQF